MSRRTERVAELIQHEVGRMLLDGIRDPRVGFVTVTGVTVSPDLSHAKIHYMVHGDDRARRDAARGLRSSTPRIRRGLAKTLSLKRVPELTFEYDETLERAERIEKIIDELHSDRPAEAVEEP